MLNMVILCLYVFVEHSVIYILKNFSQSVIKERRNKFYVISYQTNIAWSIGSIRDARLKFTSHVAYVL